MNDLNKLIGRIVKSVEMSEDKQFITFETDDGQYKFEAFADCCSDSWIEELDNPEALIGQKVNGVESFDIDSIDTDEADKKYKGNVGGQDVLSVYRYDIKTDKGICTIDFRNSSNGYYGGSLDRVYV